MFTLHVYGSLSSEKYICLYDHHTDQGVEHSYYSRRPFVLSSQSSLTAPGDHRSGSCYDWLALHRLEFHLREMVLSVHFWVWLFSFRVMGLDSPVSLSGCSLLLFIDQWYPFWLSCDWFLMTYEYTFGLFSFLLILWVNLPWIFLSTCAFLSLGYIPKRDFSVIR